MILHIYFSDFESTSFFFVLDFGKSFLFILNNDEPIWTNRSNKIEHFRTFSMKTITSVIIDHGIFFLRSESNIFILQNRTLSNINGN